MTRDELQMRLPYLSYDGIQACLGGLCQHIACKGCGHTWAVFRKMNLMYLAGKEGAEPFLPIDLTCTRCNTKLED